MAEVMYKTEDPDMEGIIGRAEDLLMVGRTMQVLWTDSRGHGRYDVYSQLLFGSLKWLNLVERFKQ